MRRIKFLFTLCFLGEGGREWNWNRYYDAWERGEVSADSRELLKKLNAKNKTRYAEEPKEDPRRKGMFRPVLDALNSAEAAEED